MNDKQPTHGLSTDAGVVKEALNNLLGIVNGIVCDDNLADAEVRFLATWLEANQHVAHIFPANIIARRVSEVMSDGILTQDEKSKLLADLKTISTTGLAESVPELPPHVASAFAREPLVEIPKKLFVLTGEFVFGSRPVCERAIMKRGGSVGSSVSARTSYLVVGGMATPGVDRAELRAQDPAGRRIVQVRASESRRDPRIRLGRGAYLRGPLPGTKPELRFVTARAPVGPVTRPGRDWPTAPVSLPVAF